MSKAMKNIVVITNSELLSEALKRYLEHFLDADVYYFTYENMDLLDKELYGRMDLFIFDLIRVYKNMLKVRAEGILMAKSFLNATKKVLIIAPHINCEKINSPIYWDIACREELWKRVQHLLENTVDLDYKKDIEKIEKFHSELLTSPSHHSHNK